MSKPLIKAAGGLVLNKKNQLLMIFRRDNWDLPKGKWEEGESIEECALREVQEETGVHNLQIEKLIGTTMHSYFNIYTNEDVDKETSWFLMSTADTDLVPQTEEDIEIAEWVNLTDVHTKLTKTYPNIKDIIDRSGLITK